MSDETSIESEQSLAGTVLTEEQVNAFLRKHPDFFVKHPALLADLSLPHDSGTAISLVERQVSILRERNIDMRHRMGKLLDNARDNDKLFEKTKRLILTLLEGHDLGDIVDALLYSFDNDFEIHYTAILLYGSPHNIPASAASIVSLSTASTYIAQFLKTNRAFCGSLTQEECHFIF